MRPFLIAVKSNWILLIILILATFLRFAGTNPGYNQYHSDEGISYSAAVSMIRSNTFDPERYDYPALIPIINFLFFKFIFIPLNWTWYFLKNFILVIDGIIQIPPSELEQKRIFQLFILGERERNALFWGRYVTALFSLGNVFLSYLIARKLFNKYVGLIAALFLAINFRHVLNSHIGLPDIYNSFFLLLAIFACINLLNKPTLRNYLIGGLAVGLSFSTKYQVYSFISLFLVHLYIVGAKKFSLKRYIFPLALSGLTALSVFVILNPYLLIHFEAAQEIIDYVGKKYGLGVNKLNFYPIWYLVNIDLGVIIFLTFILGVIISLKKYSREGLILLGPLALFFYLFIYNSAGGFYTRNYITLTPIIIIFASLFFWELYKYLRGILGRFSIIIILILIAAAVYVPAKNALTNSYFYTKPWSYEVTRDWQSKNLPEGITIAAHPFDPLEVKNVKRAEFTIDGNYSLAEHAEAGVEYGQINMDWGANEFYYWMNCDTEMLKNYCKKPWTSLRNSFAGIAAEEYVYYQIFSSYKPWQAPEPAMFIAKIPKREELLSNIIYENSFEDKEDVSQLGNEFIIDVDQSIGNASDSSLGLKLKKASALTARIYIKPIKIKQRHLYKISAFLKSEENIEQKNRDTFLRIDFYGQNINLEDRGMLTRISSRYYGNDWIEKEIIEQAPEGSEYVVISVQKYRNDNNTFWLDDLKVTESKQPVEDITKKHPYSRKEIDMNVIYPNSHGNL